MEATLDALAERGWSGTTTTEVCQRAGVSRGAQVHHFPSKQDLVLASIEYIASRQRTLVAKVDVVAATSTREVLEAFAEYFTSRDFIAALKLWMEALTDPSMRSRVVELEQHIGRAAYLRTVELLQVDEARGNNRRLIQATLDLLRGLGLAAVLSDDSERRSAVLDTWAEVLNSELAR